MNDKQIYNGFEIKFDETHEVWYTHVDENGKQPEYTSSDNKLENVSLKKLKEILDKLKKSKFERMKVFVRADNYRYGGGNDKKYSPQYTEATLTSVAPNGNAYVVKKGEKHGDKFNLKYRGSEGIFLDTPENIKIITEIDIEGEKEWKAEVLQKKLKEKLKMIDGHKVYEGIYGKELK